MEDTINLNLITQEFESKQLKVNVKGFILNYENKNYIITLHHNLPIHCVNIVDNESMMLSIKINSGWNECLILDYLDHINNCKINNMIYKTLPKKNDMLYLICDKRYVMNTIGISFIPFDNSPNGMMIPYIVASMENFENVAGLSGSPVYINNAKTPIVGVFSKFDASKNIAYILPIYIITKCLEKIDNNNIYTCDLKHIKKINTYNVNKKSEIYHPTLKIYIPLTTYFLLEGDINSQHIISYNDNNTITTIETKLSQANLLLSNECDIILNDIYYKVNIRMLVLLKRVGVDTNIIKLIWMKILSNNTNISFQIVNKHFTLKCI